MKFVSCYILILAIFMGCGKKAAQTTLEQKLDSLQSNKIELTEHIVPLSIKAKKELHNWNEYLAFDQFLNQYADNSYSEAMLNAEELANLSKLMRDSIRIEKFQIPEVKIRLNVINTISLRLADMSSIPTIKESDIQKESDALIKAYSALNLKINNMFDQDGLNSAVKNFIQEVNSLDTTVTTPTVLEDPTSLSRE